MRAKSKNRPASNSLSRAYLFGPPPIIEGEKAKDYGKLLERVFNALRPTDFVEEIWARDFADVYLVYVSMASDLGGAFE